MFDVISRILNFFLGKPLKVGLISYYYPVNSTNNGNAIHVYNLSKNLAELGCEVHIFTRGEKDKKYKEKIGKGKRIVHTLKTDFSFNIKDYFLLSRLRYLLFENKVLNKLAYENSKREFDIIHTQSWLTSGAFIMKSFNKIPWVHTFHCLEQKRLKLMTKSERRAYRMTKWIESTIVDADRLIAVSNKSREDIIKTFKSVSKKTIVIPNGVDLQIFRPTKRFPQTVLYIGRFSKEKGIELIPEIAERILKKDKRYKFIAIAAKTYNKDLMVAEEKFKELEKEYKDKFIWINETLSKEKIVELYKKAGVYVQPSFYENAPLCVLEAMASGKAIVATSVGGTPEILGKAGFLCKPDAKEISRKALKLLGDNKLRKKYGKLASERAKQFSWENVAEKTLELYKEIVDEKKKEPIKKSQNSS